ncbi:YitT family protein [Streptomyces sp. NPDC002476]|uniref:membrane protein YczE n=1 Tax=Streptomyces sp. NPDC002476 TaxID=3364648 RepID=UPI0036A699D1
MSVTSVPRGAHLARRLVQLYVGLALYGASSALLVRAGLGLEPWGVLHQGLSERSGLSIGVVSIVVGAVVLLLWIPIRQRPGLGTVSNVFVIGIAMDGTLALVPSVHGVAARIALMAAGVVLNGVATGLYIAARFGPGPRDGLMTGLHRRTGRSIRLVRTLIEVAVVVTGFVLGGSLGVGTVVYALAIGPLAQFFLRLFAVGGEPADGGTPGSGPAAGADGPAGEDGRTGRDGPGGGEASVPARGRSVAAGSPGRGTRVTGRTPGRAILPR